MVLNGISTHTFGPARLWVDRRYLGELELCRLEVQEEVSRLELGGDGGLATLRAAYPARRSLTLIGVVGRLEPESMPYLMAAGMKQLIPAGQAVSTEELAVLRSDQPYQLAEKPSASPTVTDPSGGTTYQEGVDYTYDPTQGWITALSGGQAEGKLVLISYTYTAPARVTLGVSDSQLTPVEVRLVHHHPDGKSSLSLTIWQAVVRPVGALEFRRDEMVSGQLLVEALWDESHPGEELGKLTFTGPAYAELAHLSP